MVPRSPGSATTKRASKPGVPSSGAARACGATFLHSRPGSSESLGDSLASGTSPVWWSLWSTMRVASTCVVMTLALAPSNRSIAPICATRGMLRHRDGSADGRGHLIERQRRAPFGIARNRKLDSAQRQLCTGFAVALLFEHDVRPQRPGIAGEVPSKIAVERHGRMAANFALPIFMVDDDYRAAVPIGELR